MSKKGGDHGGKILKANRALAFSNSDYCGGNEKNSGNKPPEASSNSPTTVAPPTLMVGPKRGRNQKETIGGGADSDHDHDQELHIWTERERRKKMRDMFSNLHALLPHLPSKIDKATIVDEAVGYIRTLEHTLQKLQKQKLDMLRGKTTIVDLEASSSVMAPPPPPPLPVLVQPLESRESFMADQECSNSSRNNQAIITSSNSAMANSFGIPCFPICFQTWTSPNVVLSVFGNDAQICVCTQKKPGLLIRIFCIMEKHKLEVVTANISSDNYRSMYMIHAHVNGAADQFSEKLTVVKIYTRAVEEMIHWLSP